MAEALSTVTAEIATLASYLEGDLQRIEKYTATSCDPGPVAKALATQSFTVLRCTPTVHPSSSLRHAAFDLCAGTVPVHAWTAAMVIEYSMPKANRILAAKNSRRTFRLLGAFPWVPKAGHRCLVNNYRCDVCNHLGRRCLRPNEYSGETLRMLTDVGWFLFLFDWPVFSLWQATVGAAIMCDPARNQHYRVALPALAFGPPCYSRPMAGLVIFFKNGPFAYNGVISFYFATAMFFAWMLALLVATLRSRAWRVSRTAPARHCTARQSPSPKWRGISSISASAISSDR
jgi:hypothetical protein